MSPTETPEAVKEVEKPNEPMEKKSSEISTKEPGADRNTLATPTEEEVERRKRRNRDRQRRRKENRHAIREGLAGTGGIGSKEVKEALDEDRMVRVAVGKRPNKPQTPKKKNSGESKASTNNAVVLAEGNGGSGVSSWRMSSALGGRFLPLDMVFSQDEKFFLLAHSCSLKIYSTKTSLQVREFNLDGKPSEVITSFKLDPLDSSKVYISTSASTICFVDWTTGKLVKSWQLSNIRTIQCLAICLDERAEDEETHGILYVGGSRPENPPIIIQRVKLSLSVAPIEGRIYVVPKSSPITYMQALDQGSIVTAIAGNTLIIGNKNTEEDSSDKKSWGVFRQYPMSFHLACMDAYIPSRSDMIAQKGEKSNRESRREVDQLGDVVVGDNQGALHLFHNVLRAKGVSKGSPVISKMHWHRSRVQAIKWTLDGRKYIISGGSETVLVIWQLGTGFKQFLPHLGATIQNIAISPQGSSYGVGFADNSVMVLSTTEFKPTSSVTGIQSRVFRLEKDTEYPRFTCVTHPTLPNRLLLASPSSQTDLYSSAPSLQTFDISSNRQIYRQALTKNNVTSVNQGPDEYRIKEPNLPHLAITKDGKWLASIDEWKPPKKRPFNPNQDGRSLQEDDSDQSEVSLKFWKWGEKSLSWELATIVKSPHPSSSSGPEEVLDLVAAPRAHLFATLAGDGSIRLWKPKVRARDGARLRGEDSEITVWSCRKVIKFSRGKKEQQVLAQNLLGGMGPQKVWWGSATFSEDNSVIAAAVPSSLGDSAIYLADPSSGAIVHFLSGLQVGETAEIAILERYLIILGTSKLLVWNMVNGTAQWEFNLRILLSVDNPVTHLAVDYVSQTFAITISQPDAQSPKVFIFEAPHPTPVHVQRFDCGYQIMALIATDTGKGYVTLDNQARVRCLSPILAGPVQHVSAGDEEEEQEALADAEEDEPTIGILSGAYLSTTTHTMSVEDRMDLDYHKGDGIVDHVVSREALENILDSTPSYAIGSLEYKFDQVLQLFAKAPLLSGDGDRDRNDREGVEEKGGLENGSGNGDGNGEDAMEE
ncbi:WD40 repeat-like protein [Tuber magnatum]|uniref:WD40 repeat-like protein n=1 Tax=Tuber magnatum TaxID=42249 RepID=A0A317SFY5_9PEZI|nr:WD40 repeat-like protein [Tuber magnatum]